MGCSFLILRPLLQVLVGLIVFSAFGYHLFYVFVNDRLLASDFYGDALASERVYDRFYDEALVDPALQDRVAESLKDAGVPAEDVPPVGKRIMPPAYLQGEVERVMDAFLAYMKKDASTLEISVDFGEPLDNARGELLAYVEQRIDDLEVTPVAPRDLPQRLEAVFREMQEGKLPDSAPSMASAPVDARLEAYDRTLESLRQDREFPRSVLASVEDPEADRAIRQELASEGEPVRGVLQEASRRILTPLIDAGLDEMRQKMATPQGDSCQRLRPGADLSNCTRYDLLRLADDQEETLEDLEEIRDGIGGFRSVGSWLPITAMVIGLLGVAALSMPRVLSAMRWTGAVLGLTGLFFYVLRLSIESPVSIRVGTAVRNALERDDMPESVLMIASDVATRMVSDAAGVVTTPCLTMLAVGVALFAASYIINKLPVIGKLPFVSSSL